jgi:hypothetical protein
MKRLIVQVPFLVSLVAFGGYATYVTYSRPTRPNPALGYVYPMPAHGPNVYLDWFDALVLIGCAAVVVATFAIAQVMRRRGTW